MNEAYELPNPELPHSQHMEIAILGTAMLDAQSAQDAVAQLAEADFYFSTHKTIFRRILGLVHSGRGVDYSMVREELEKHKELPSVGGPGFVASLSEGIPRNFSIGDYIVIVKNKAQLRALYAANQFGQEESVDPSEMAADLAERQIERLQGIVTEAGENPLVSVGDFLASQGEGEEALEQMATLGGLKLGWQAFDEMTGGLQRKELMVLAAMASTGKSAWAANVAFHTSVREGKVVAFFPLEDKRSAAVRRMLSSASRVDYRSIRDGRLSSHDKAILLEHRHMLAQANLYIDDTSGMTMTKIKSKCMRLKRQMIARGHEAGLDLILIDQLPHVEHTDITERGLSTEEKTGRKAHLAKKMAEELNVPVVLLHQMTQEGAKRVDPRPKLTDLAGSGQIKNHASIVAFLHRPEMYDKADPELAGKGEQIIVKNREGKTGICHSAYHGDIMRWEDPRSETTQADFSGRFREDW